MQIGITISSAEFEMPYPSVIRLKYYVKIPHRASLKLSRKAILVRDKHECAYCGAYADTMDHIVPRAKGGDHSWMNIVAACKKCNTKKADYLLEDLDWKLRYQPTIPAPKSWIVIGLREREQWEPYLESI